MALFETVITMNTYVAIGLGHEKPTTHDPSRT
nr:MAG TPA: hypothetical protein [Caudoviricetes sp.]